MKRHHAALGLLALILISTIGSSLTLADTFAYTSFEEPDTGGRYTDTGDPSTDHPLINNPGEAPVNYTSTGGELGFSSYYINTRDDVGLTDGDFVGVTSYTGVVGSFPDGDQGFQMSDPDGAMRTTFDTVDLTGFLTPTVSLQYYVQETDWEMEDVLRIWVDVDGTELDLFDTTGEDIDDLAIEGSWNTVSQTLTGYMTATLNLMLDANSGDEAVYFDNVLFTTASTIDTPPQVLSTAPASGTTGVSLDSAITITFDEDVELVNEEAVSMACPASHPITLTTQPDLPFEGTKAITITPLSPLPIGATCTVTATSDFILDLDLPQDTLDGDSDGLEGGDYIFTFTTAECGGEATLLHEIQGSGLESPMEGMTVTVEAVVVGDFQDGDGDEKDLNGFFIQEEQDDWDGDATTSEGIFVYGGNSPLMDVEQGDLVRLTGVVDEQYGLTQIESLTELGRCSTGHALTYTTVTLPVTGTAPLTGTQALEIYEGMLISMTQELVISEFYNFDRYGEIVLTMDRQFQPTAIYQPDTPEAEELALENELRRIQLDDGRTSQNPDPARHPNGMPFTLDNRFRGGDTVQNVVGVLGYSFGSYEIQPTAGADYTRVNERPEMPDDVGGDVTVAAFNVLNYFTTLDDGAGDICGPEGDQECRGADTENEFDRQKAKIVAAMCEIDADVFGLMELENQNPSNDPDPGDGIANYVLKDLVDGLNDPDSDCPEKTYTFWDSGSIGADAIRQGVVYKENTVTPTGRAVLSDTTFTDPNDLGDEKNRAAIAMTFEHDDGGTFTVVVNHLKSKGSPCGEGDDDPMQGNCNDTRTDAAQELADWLATNPTGTSDPDYLIIGDLNAYDKEDPIDVLRAEGYTDLLLQYEGERAYSYVFDGQLGYLDYALANQPLLPQVTGATVWHINADEPDILNYDTSYKKDAQDALYEPNPYRSSDHDPVIVGLDLEGQVEIYLPIIAQGYSP